MVWFILAGAISMGGLGSYVARQKGRSGGEGFFFGFLLGPLGVIVEGVLPTAGPPPTRPRSLAERAWTPRPRTGDPRRAGGPRGDLDGTAVASTASEIAAPVSRRARYRARPKTSTSPVLLVVAVALFGLALIITLAATRS